MRLDIIKTIFSRLNLFEKTSVPTTPASGIGSLWLRDDSTYGRKSIAYVGDDGIVKDLAEYSSIVNLFGKGSAYFGNGTDQYFYIPDNVNLQFGTSNFALIFPSLNLPDYTPSAAVTLVRKANTTDYLGFICTLETDGKPQIVFGNTSNFTTLAYKSTSAIDVADGSMMGLAVVVTRESTSAAGSVVFYQFGKETIKLLSSVSITSGAPQTVTETNKSALTFFQNINGSTEYAFTRFGGAYICNFAPSMAEIKDLMECGVPYKYKDASQTELFSGKTWTNSGFDNFTSSGNEITDADDNGSGVVYAYLSPVFYFEAGKAYQISYTLGGTWSSGYFRCGFAKYNDGTGDSINLVYHTTGTTNYSTTFISPYTGNFYFIVKNNDYAITNLSVTSLSLRRIGCVAEYLPEGVGNYTWFDNSINAIHGTVNGATPVGLPPNDIQTAVKIGIANTATALSGIVPAGYYIKQIRAKGSTSLSGVKIGTSSGGEQVVASTSVETTPTLLTLASTANAAYSESAATTLYAQHGTAGATLDLYLVLERIK